MLKLPILGRTKFYARNLDGSFRRLPWNLVQTSLGAMAEPVSISLYNPDAKGGYVEQDNIDMSWTDEQFVDEASMFGILGTYGPTVLLTMNEPTP